jgi:serine-type D-Ala-D-Ala carboxypeptidase/endopeptidase
LTLTKGTSSPSDEVLSDDAILAILRDQVETARQCVGVVAGVLDQGGRRTFSYGRSGSKNARPLDGDTVFEIGSITKVFTALLLAEMATRGEVALEDPVAKYLPADVKTLSRGRKKITLIDLATYTSGLPRMPSNFRSKHNDNPYADYTIKQLYEFVSGYKLPHDPGVHYEYANLGFGLLGHALALKAGRSYEELIVDRICSPLAMNSTRVTPSSTMQERLAWGHKSTLEPTVSWSVPTLTGAGGLLSTANDLLTFLNAVNCPHADAPLHVAARRLLKTQRPTRGPAEGNNAALGWFVKVGPKDVIILKGGGTGGYSSFIGYSSWSGRASVILSNTQNSIEDVGLHLVNPNFPLKQYPPQIEVEPDILATYVGVYSMRPGFTLTVRAYDKRLFVRATGQGEYELFADSENRFFMRAVDAQAIFLREIDGAVCQLIWHQGGRYQYCRRAQ